MGRCLMISLRKFMKRVDLLAVLLSIIAFLASATIADKVFERIPHLEDEMTYVWQAQVISRGQLSVPTPPCSRCFLVPFVSDFDGIRFGKYPLGWPVIISAGLLLDARHLVNPLLAGFSTWLVYLLFKKILDEKTALLGTFLLVSSPFFLMNSASLLPHPFGLFLTVVLASSWLDTFSGSHHLPKPLTAITAGLALCGLILTRPLTAVGIGIPFFIHGLYLLFGNDQEKKRWVMTIGILAAFGVLLHLGWQLAVTGNPFHNPYTLWWPYDQIGFGVDVGLQQGGYQPADALTNASFSLWVGSHDLFGWFKYSWLFIPIGLIAIYPNQKTWLTVALMPSLVFAYGFYWIGSWVFGPRYYYEAIISPVLLTAAGIRWLAGRQVGKWPKAGWNWISRLRLSVVGAVCLLLVTLNLLYYIPLRIGAMRGLYDVHQSRLSPFHSPDAAKLTPALVIVIPKKNWIEYGNLLEISSPYLDSPFIFTFNRGRIFNQWVIDNFPERKLWYYYTDEPGVFYTQPR